MAGATTACVPARAGTILGVTRSITNPAFRRLEQYESMLRLAVPALLALFLVTLATSAWVQVRDSREETVLDAIGDIDTIASLAALKLDMRPAPRGSRAAALQLAEFAQSMPSASLSRSRVVLLAD